MDYGHVCICIKWPVRTVYRPVNKKHGDNDEKKLSQSN